MNPMTFGYSFSWSSTTTAPTHDVHLVGQASAGGHLAGATDPHRLIVNDGGKAASPTATELDGWDRVDTLTGETVRVPGLVDRATHADLLVCTVGDLAAALAELDLGPGE